MNIIQQFNTQNLGTRLLIIAVILANGFLVYDILFDWKHNQEVDEFMLKVLEKIETQQKIIAFYEKATNYEYTFSNFDPNRVCIDGICLNSGLEIIKEGEYDVISHGEYDG